MQTMGQELLSDQQKSVVRAANQADAVLLITGSTGVGKSHLAYSAFSSHQKRKAGKWYKINLATLSENLVESELFGHERGAFTGADSRRIGRLEFCNGGTVFLDEIGELSPRIQAKLLDFIQYKKISPVGSNREISLDVRIIAATNKNLERAVRQGQFRADLYHRLDVFHVQLGDLVAATGRIVELAKKFLVVQNARVGGSVIGFSADAVRLLEGYTWPGNIRELENAVEYAAAMCSGRVIEPQHLPAKILKQVAPESMVALEDLDRELPKGTESEGSLGYIELPISHDFYSTKAAFEKAYIENALRWCRGQINLTSRRIGLNKVSLTDKIRRHAIDWKRIRYECLTRNLS